MIYRCLFEQSGTFKNVLRSLGFEAYDYDILDDFGETDYKIDLFEQIDSAWKSYRSIFDDFKGDTVIAFFPCVRFSAQFQLCFRQEAHQYIKDEPVVKYQRSIKYMEELQRLFTLLNQLCILAHEKGFRLIIENPINKGLHFLSLYWWLKPSVVIRDRGMWGDYYEKPTQFFFVNGMAYDNIVFEPVACNRKTKGVVAQSTVERSMIHPDFALWFIKSFVLSPEELCSIPSVE